MFDYIGIDWGSKRFGLCYGDSNSQLVIPYQEPLPSDTIWVILKQEIESRKITHAVFGIPTNFQLGDTQVSTQIRDFITQFNLNFPQITVATINERGTSKDASSTSNDKDDINHIAAVHILTRYFNEMMK